MNKKFKFILENLIKLVLLLIAVSFITVLLVDLSPVDVLNANYGQSAVGVMSNEQINKLKDYWGTDKTVTKRYISWLSDFIKGDMGVSLLYRQPVFSVIADKLKNSIVVLSVSWLFSGFIGYFIGSIAGINEGKIADKIIKMYCVIISSTPAFYVAIILLMIFGVWLNLLPIGFFKPIGVVDKISFLDILYHAILPAFTLSITGAANVALHTREKVVDIMNSDYVLFAKARGESKWQIYKNHCIRNSFLPAVTIQFSTVGEIIGGSIVVEQIFSYPGLGNAAVKAGLGGDVPLLVGITIVSAVFVFFGNLTANIITKRS